MPKHSKETPRDVEYSVAEDRGLQITVRPPTLAEAADADLPPETMATLHVDSNSRAIPPGVPTVVTLNNLVAFDDSKAPKKGRTGDVPRKASLAKQGSWRGWEIEIVGLRLPRQEAMDFPMAVLHDGTVLQIWRRRLWGPEIPCFIEERWNPIDGYSSAMQNVLAANEKQVREMFSARHVLYAVAPVGRPEKTFSEITLGEIEIKCRALAHSAGFTKQNVAFDLGIDTSTFEEHLKRLDVRWVDLKRKMRAR